MNNVCIAGNLTRDPEIRYSTGEKATAIARFSVALQRKFKNAEGKYDADFPNVVAMGKTAEFIEKWFHKGDRIEVNGEIRTGSYTNKDGVKVYTTEVYANDVAFGGGKNSGEAKPNDTRGDGFMNIPESLEEELPFN